MESKNIQCTDCMAVYPSSLGKHHDRVCGELLKLNSQDDNNELSKRGLFRTRCPFCPNDFSYFHSRLEVAAHLKKHHQITLKGSSKKSTADKHSKKCGFSCTKCRLSFESDELSSLHLATCSFWQYLWSCRENPDFDFCCVFCAPDGNASSFASFQAFEDHLRKSHGVTILDKVQPKPKPRPRKRKRVDLSESPYNYLMLSSEQRKVDFAYKTPCLYKNCTFTHSIQPHLNFEHYKETHNKRFSSRHYCPMESCNSSYSRKNVLAAHLRKAHEVPEDDLVEHTSHDEPLTIDCLLCGADLTSLSTAERNEHFEKIHQFDPHYYPSVGPFTSELLDAQPPRPRLNSIDSNPNSETERIDPELKRFCYGTEYDYFGFSHYY